MVVNIEQLPNEVLLYILSFMDARFISDVIVKVSRKFNILATDESVWRARILTRWPKPYPVVCTEDFSWRNGCVLREEFFNLWSNWEEHFRKYSVQYAHCGSVDAVKILQKSSQCLTGARDHSLKLWDLTELGSKLPNDTPEPRHSNLKAHDSWVWTISDTGCDNMIISGSWDQSAKTWDLGSNLTNVNKYTFSSPVLSISSKERLFSAGTFSSQVYLLDTREDPKDISPYHTCHKRSVLCVTMDDDILLSGSEDGTLVVFDRRAKKLRQRIQVSGYPTALSYHGGQLWVGTRTGYIYVMDTQKDPFTILDSSKVCGSSIIYSIYHTLGGVLTFSRDNVIRAVEPTLKPRPFVEVKPSHNLTRMDMDLRTNTIAAGAEGSVHFWIPVSLDNYCQSSDG